MSPDIPEWKSWGLLATGASLPAPTLSGHLIATARNAAPLEKDGEWNERG